MNVRQAIFAALRGDPSLVPKVKGSLRERIDETDGPMSTMVQAAEALEPIIADAVLKRPSKLGKFGLKSAHMLAELAAEDDRANKRLAKFAHGTTLGIVFVDVAGFTTFTERVGDDAARKLLARLSDLVAVKARACKGEVVKELGDGFLLVFPSASQAVRGALSLRDAVLKQREKDPAFEVTLRCAVHAGEPLVEQDDLFGYDVNLTARLLDHCKPNEVVVSETAKDLAAKRLRSVEFGRRKMAKIRGLSTK
ncbi:MAG: adenylate cyclase, partial [Actinomycetota bacterium]|nr:adenylate cyclase [Actinomycetota bacterium]